MRNQILTGLPPTSGRRLSRAGFTMVELLVSMGVGAIVLMAMVMFFLNTNRSYLNQDEMIVMNQNLRLAMDSISRDVRMAGSGMGLFGNEVNRVYISYNKSVAGAYQPKCYPSATGPNPGKASDGKYGIVPVDSCDGEIDGTDGISLLGFMPFMGSPLGATDGYTGHDPIEGLGWNKDMLDDFRIKTAQPLAIAVLVEDSGDYKPRIFVTSGLASTSESGTNYNFSLPVASSGALQSIYNTGAYAQGGPYGSVNYYTFVMGDFFWLHYFIDRTETTNPKLTLWARHTGVAGQEEMVVANAIEDLQFKYMVDDDPTAYDSLSDNAIDLDKNRVTAVKVALVARTERPSATGGRFSPVQVYNHTTVGPVDSYRRQALETVVYLRNAR